MLQEKGWRGLFLGAAAYPAKYGVKQERVDAININPILRKYRVARDHLIEANHSTDARLGRHNFHAETVQI